MLSIENPEGMKSTIPAIVDSLRALNIFGVTLAHPFILSMLRCREEGDISTRNVRACLQKIEKFHFLYTAITSSRASGISNKYAAYAKRLFEAETTDEKNRSVRELTFEDKFPSFEEFGKKFQEILFYKKNTKNKSLVRYILTKLDKHFKQPGGRVVNYDEMTIEHIISQEKHSDYGELIGKIGNLILVDRETQEKLGTKSLEEKIDILHESDFDKKTFFLSNSIKDGKHWIEKRTNAISKAIYAMFTGK